MVILPKESVAEKGVMVQSGIEMAPPRPSAHDFAEQIYAIRSFYEQLRGPDAQDSWC